MDNKFKQLVADILDVDVNILNNESSSQNINEWDSLLHWEIISAIESHYQIRFTMDEAADFQNLGEIYKALFDKN